MQISKEDGESLQFDPHYWATEVILQNFKIVEKQHKLNWSQKVALYTFI